MALSEYAILVSAIVLASSVATTSLSNTITNAYSNLTTEINQSFSHINHK